MMSAICHVAGPFDGQYQACARCGESLIDYRSALVESPDGKPPRGWEEGAEVVRVRTADATFDGLRAGYEAPFLMCERMGLA
jgi:hypothetical protein